ncbi:glycosyltransferase [Piscinibacter sp.]|jgi:alpha-1,6-mannosyltransferase|uniref:glycosyltransferase n=1 Tax=Piscinibacter sp. TaxID=1903157 RepID=UPI002F3E7832
MTPSEGASRPAPHLVDATMFWSASGGGVRRYLQAKHAWLALSTRVRHTIAAPVAGAGDVATLPSLPLPGSGGYRLPVRRRALAQALVKLSPDLIEAGDPYRLAWSTLDAAQQLQVPAIAFCHSNLELMAAGWAGRPLARAAARAARRYARHLYDQFDLVLAPSEAMCRHLLDWGITHVAHQPLGVDSALFHPARASAMWRNQLGLPQHTRLLLYAGRFAPEKHLDVLAAAVRRLGAPYVLLAIGAGPAPPSGERVMVRPYVSDARALATVLASVDAFVHAGDQETFGLSVLEAMACGTPVVARAVEGLAELVDDSVGIAVRVGSADSFAQGISDLFCEDGKSRSRAARRRAEWHDWNRVLPALMTHYARLLRDDAQGPASAPRSLPSNAAALP